MSSIGVSSDAVAEVAEAGSIEMKLEVLVLPYMEEVRQASA